MAAPILITIIEWLATITAVVGTLLLASKNARSGRGVMLYLISGAD